MKVVRKECLFVETASGFNLAWVGNEISADLLNKIISPSSYSYEFTEEHAKALNRAGLYFELEEGMERSDIIDSDSGTGLYISTDVNSFVSYRIIDFELTELNIQDGMFPKVEDIIEFFEALKKAQ